MDTIKKLNLANTPSNCTPADFERITLSNSILFGLVMRDRALFEPLLRDIFADFEDFTICADVALSMFSDKCDKPRSAVRTVLHCQETKRDLSVEVQVVRDVKLLEYSRYRGSLLDSAEDYSGVSGNYVVIFCDGDSWPWGSDQYIVYGSTRYATYDGTRVSGNDGRGYIYINYDSVYTSSCNTRYITAVCNYMSKTVQHRPCTVPAAYSVRLARAMCMSRYTESEVRSILEAE